MEKYFHFDRSKTLQELEDNYWGDLLDTVSKVDINFWKSNPSYKNDLEDIIEKNINDLKYRLCSFQQRFIK